MIHSLGPRKQSVAHDFIVRGTLKTCPTTIVRQLFFLQSLAPHSTRGLPDMKPLGSVAIRRRYCEARGVGGSCGWKLEDKGVSVGRLQSGDASPHSKGAFRFGLFLVLACVGLWGVNGVVAAEAGGDSAQPQLELTITGPQKAAVGSDVTFEIAVRNAGKIAAKDLLIVDRFDAGLEHEAAVSPIERDLKDLQPGESQRLGVAFRVTRPGQLVQRVEITRQGKSVLATRSSLIATGPAATTDSAAGTSPPAEQPPKTSPSPTANDDFPDGQPKDGPPSAEEKMPDLGSPLVDNVVELKRLHEKFPVWIDRKQHRVIVIGLVCQRQVPLELFACLRGSKEHESVLTVPTKASIVHAALLAVGAEAGSPVQFRPKYAPARGTEIEITCVWKDAQGKRQSARAQEWVRATKTGKTMEYPWVFGGSRFMKSPFDGKTHYQADAEGDFICVSNFPGAMLDLPVQSTSTDAELMFDAFTEHIPPRGTSVTLILAPKLAKPDANGPSPATNPAGPSASMLRPQQR